MRWGGRPMTIWLASERGSTPRPTTRSSDSISWPSSPSPPDFTCPLGIEVAATPGMDVKSGRWPSPRPFRVDGLDEQFLVHEGTIRGLYPLVFTARPGTGDHVIRAIVRYLLCSASACWPPATTTVDLPVREVVLAGRSLPPVRS